MNCVYVINETHKLMEEQEQILNKTYDEVERKDIPKEGLKLSEIDAMAKELMFIQDGDTDIIIVSPIPALMAKLAKNGTPFKVFHNDRREKKELPDGRIIMTVAKTGWVLV